MINKKDIILGASMVVNMIFIGGMVCRFYEANRLIKSVETYVRPYFDDGIVPDTALYRRWNDKDHAILLRYDYDSPVDFVFQSRMFGHFLNLVCGKKRGGDVGFVVAQNTSRSCEDGICYELSARNVFFSWQYDELGKCKKIVFQCNDGPCFRDQTGGGEVENSPHRSELPRDGGDR